MLETVFNSIAIFFDTAWGFLAYLTLAFLSAFFFGKNQKVFIIALIVSLALGAGLKLFFDQPRPCVEGYFIIPCPFSSGFPSNHALIATAIAMGAFGTFAFLPLFGLSIIVSLSRLWLGVHSLEQVAGGMALAVMIYLAVFEAWQKIFGSDMRFDLDEILDENLLTKKIG